MTWTPELTESLIRMWATGASYTQIARALRVTRSAVSGKVDRLGLSNEGRARPPRKPAQARSKPSLVPVPPSFPPEPAPLAVRPVKNGDQQFHHCRYGFGDPATEEFRFCGATRTKGWYCDTHWALCNVPVPQRKTA